MLACWTLLGVGTLVMVCAPSYEWALVGQCLSGFGMAGNSLAWYPVVLEFAPVDKVDRYMGVYMTAFGVRVFVAVLISGALMQSGPLGSWDSLAIASAIMLLGVAGMFAMRCCGTPQPDQVRAHTPHS